ncbi:hypothetical protein [Phormidium tenue]|jgi:hypothetical protein|uniref:Uncharacterized protein n=1 Tax=Phormidium tenue FACHB-1050 TaxID=2692857 RepID=A0ABR8CDB5_9CYAN|nr:hypothetical protein [Phormidium tenue]MBD2317702.1 hypothetical protein [Phormidium tenue FACHB-1050]
MTVHLPEIGITNCRRAKALLEEYPQNIVGSFWIMSGYGFDKKEIPSWWVDVDNDIYFEDNQAQLIIDAYEAGLFDGEHNNPLYLGFCIIVVADPDNPANLSYVIQHLRMWEGEGIGILRIMAHFNIPAITKVIYPESFLKYRYGYASESNTYRNLRVSLDHWSVHIWEDYCSYQMSNRGQTMFYKYCKRVNIIKDEVQTTVKKGSKFLVLTEGETDPIYIRTALDLLGKTEILAQVDIEWVGASVDKGKSINTGDSGLNNTRDVLLSNPKFLTRKVLLLYDCDTKKQSADYDNLKIRSIPKQENRKIKKGIENLFPDHLFTKEFYLPKTKIGDYGEVNKIQEFQKMRFCKWICSEKKDAKDFADFKVIVDILNDFLNE